MSVARSVAEVLRKHVTWDQRLLTATAASLLGRLATSRISAASRASPRIIALGLRQRPETERHSTMGHQRGGIGVILERAARAYLERGGHGALAGAAGRYAPVRRSGGLGRGLGRLALALGGVLVLLGLILLVGIVLVGAWLVSNADTLLPWAGDLLARIAQLVSLGRSVTGGAAGD